MKTDSGQITQLTVWARVPESLKKIGPVIVRSSEDIAAFELALNQAKQEELEYAPSSLHVPSCYITVTTSENAVEYYEFDGHFTLWELRKTESEQNRAWDGDYKALHDWLKRILAEKVAEYHSSTTLTFLT